MKPVKVQGVTYYSIPIKHIKRDLPALLPLARPGYVKNVTLHWTAGGYSTGYRAYQVLIGPETILVSASLLAFFRHQHTFRRNTHNIGVCFMAMAGATERNAGRFPVTARMVETASLVVGMLQKKYSLGKSQVVDHAHFAHIDGYRSWRWDIRFPWAPGENMMDVVRRKAWWYREKLRQA